MQLRSRISLLAGAWAAAGLGIVLTTIPVLRDGIFTLCLGFPSGISWGLARIGTGAWFNSVSPEWTVVLGWLAYLALTGLCLVTPRKTVFLPLYGTLCLLFLLNIIGCYTAAHFHM